MKKIILLLILLVVLGLSYEYSRRQTRVSTPVAVEPTQSAVETQTVVKPKITMFGGIGVARTNDDTYMVDQEGRTLYFNTQDEGRKSTTKPVCDSTCEKTWLPYLYDGKSGGIAQNSKDPFLSRLNFYTRSDGQRQYSLGTKPLYRYTEDTQSGEKKGESISEWQVARP